MKKEVLANGLTVIYEKFSSRSVVIQVMIKAGSNHENSQERGISHFLEHILFEGTKKRLTNREISNEIEKIGGDINAYTSNERTCFYVRVLKKHFSVAIGVLADILQNPLLRPEDIEREKNIVLKEIEMVNDEPRFYQWILLQKTLFKKHPCRNPTYGEKENILSLNQEKIKAYFMKYYVPNNMVISIVGDVKNWKKEVEQNFAFTRKPVVHLDLTRLEPKEKRNIVTKEKKDITNTYFILGFKTVPKNNDDAYALELINTIMGRGQSSIMFTEIRTKLGLAYDVGSQHVAEVSYGYFALYACVDHSNVEKTKELILKELYGLKNIPSKMLKEAKTAIEGEFYLDIDDPQKRADQLLFWEQSSSAHDINSFVAKIKAVTQKDIKRVIEKYFKNYTFVVLEGREKKGKRIKKITP
ncbi:insulinase family protein [Candidatus Woesearchaeota archaeon]|nr:insulinase family protein [Candidatus Woesearchaeota archaeon]